MITISIYIDTLPHICQRYLWGGKHESSGRNEEEELSFHEHVRIRCEVHQVLSPVDVKEA